jgi:NTP pyrophosphatase (non-canonical NTP hydrolase)
MQAKIRTATLQAELGDVLLHQACIAYKAHWIAPGTAQV